MTEQNTGWRDISTVPYDEVVLFYTHDGNIVQDFMYDCGTKQMAGVYTHWQPLLPPPGEEVEDWYALGVKDGRDGCLVELDALQARCDELEAAARILLRDPDDHDGENIRWVREFDLKALRSVVDAKEME